MVVRYEVTYFMDAR